MYPGEDPMLLGKTHHVSLLRLLIKYGFPKTKSEWKRVIAHPYFQERRHRYNIHMYRWTDSHVKEHIKHRWETFLSLKKKGFKAKKSGDRPVVLLKNPLFETRYNWDSGFLKAPECWDGMGRCSSAFVLGWKKIPVVFAEDAKPGACEFKKAFDKIKK